ncbi:hypothetical protein D3C81_2083890 [compost metagenome]
MPPLIACASVLKPLAFPKDAAAAVRVFMSEKRCATQVFGQPIDKVTHHMICRGGRSGAEVLIAMHVPIPCGGRLELR